MWKRVLSGSAGTNSEESRSAEGPASIARFRREYIEAEAFVGNVSEFEAGLANSAHRELRLAGRCFLDALDDDGGLADDRELRRAIGHCQRAKLVSARAGVSSALERIGDFDSDYRTTVVADIVPNYGGIRKKTREARNLAETTALLDETDPQPAMEMFVELSEMARTLDDARPEIDKRVERERRANRLAILALAATIALGAAGIVLALVL